MSNDVKSVEIGKIACFWDKNTPRFHREDKDKARNFDPTDDKSKDLIASLVATHGFDPSYGSLQVEAISDADAKRWVNEKNTQWADLKDREKAGEKVEVKLNAFQECFVEKGKIITPEYLVITGHRRCLSIPYALEQVFEANATKKGPSAASLGFKLTVTVVVRKFDSESERVYAQLDENQTKLLGVKGLSLRDIVYALRPVFRLGQVLQVDLRNKWGAGNGQRIWGILVLGERRPKLNLFNRLFEMGEKDTQYLRAQSLPQDMASIIRRTDRDALEAYTKTAKYQAMSAEDRAKEVYYDDEAVERWLKSEMEGGNTDPIAKKTQIESLATTGSPMQQAVAKAIRYPAKMRETLEKVKHLHGIDTSAATIHERDPKAFEVVESFLAKLAETTDGKVVAHVLESLKAIEFAAPATKPAKKGK